jgi:hypothetical protein
VRDTCATRSRACAESPSGTASRARRWLLVEQPGAWGPDALTGSALPTEVAAGLQALARSLPARVLLLRRTRAAARRRTDERRSVYVGSTTPRGGWLEHLALDDVRDLLAVDLAPLGEGRSVGGQPVSEPLYLVCTNGRHDPCCAEHGRPVAQALTEVVGERVWECSHVGGDRFAGNLVCLPDGVFYGHLDPVTALRAVEAHEDRRLLLDHWRGNSSLPFVVQAAEAFVRSALDQDRLGAITFRGTDRVGEHHRVRFALPDGTPVAAVVAVTQRDVPQGLTCAGTGRSAPHYDLVALER